MAAERRRTSRQVSHVCDLHFREGNLDRAGASGEVGVRGHRRDAQSASLHALAETMAIVLRVIEH